MLNYFDGVHLGHGNGTRPVFRGAMDDVCPPSTVFAGFNAYGLAAGTEKQIEVYRFNSHEGGQEHHRIRQLQFVKNLLAA